MPQELAAPPAINPTAEEAYWRDAYRREPYYRAEFSYEDYSPAYRVGYTGPVRRHGEFDELEHALKDDFQRVRGRSRLRWEEAREATRAAWRRVTKGEHPH
ncbi:hypothetical protein LZ009_03410 [Ramlibacter sp. XY19]|uniref:hypothetical protein n=1 Tax=Ramlibacter paludis TaxID=2908000 RepID=UPI0023D99CBA|nr:hypothetical protein [Ramlibacter paludis]MCG2591820.1 hypothetical protein [Ramlibacter paludis]